MPFENEENLEPNQFAWISFIQVLRQLILMKLAVIEEQVVPLFKGARLRIENYFDVALVNGGFSG